MINLLILQVLNAPINVKPLTPSMGRVGTKLGFDNSTKQMPNLKRRLLGTAVICELR